MSTISKQPIRRNKIIYILSPKYSGSTLLTFLLMQHTEAAGIGERHNFWYKMIYPDLGGSNTSRFGKVLEHLDRDSPENLQAYAVARCSCGQLFSKCDFWNEIKHEYLQQVPKHLQSLDLPKFQFFANRRLLGWSNALIARRTVNQSIPFVPFPIWNRFLAACHANTVIIDKVLRLNNASIFVDSSKRLYDPIFLQTFGVHDVYVIHLTRDGRAQTNSHMKWNEIDSMRVAAQKWKYTITQNMRVLEQWPGQVLHVRYEDLCANPTGKLREIYSFCSVQVDTIPITYVPTEHHIMGNAGTRFVKQEQIQDRQEWLNQLTPDQLAIFEQEAGNFNRSLGYV
jgi:hypothetical protein